MINKLRNSKILLSNIGLVLLLLLGAGYLMFAIMRFNPIQQNYSVSVELPRSGGLQSGGDVTYRGMRVGQVKDIQIAPNGLVADLEIDEKYQIPADSEISVQSLSAAGEQYVDFRPNTDKGPFLEDGAHIPASDNVKTPEPLSSVLDNVTNLVSQIPPDRFETIVNELDNAFKDGSEPLHEVITGISVALAGFDGVLPQTEALIENLRITLGTTQLAQPDLATLVSQSQVLFDNLNAANRELREFLDNAPGELDSVGNGVNDIQDSTTDIAQNFNTIFKEAYKRAPALSALFPAMAYAGQQLSLTYHPSAIGPPHSMDLHVFADIWIRPNCEYYVIPRDPTEIQDPRVPLYNYCLGDLPPNVQVRGAANAPRPPGEEDSTAGPPPGITPNGIEPHTTGFEDPNKLSSPEPGWTNPAHAPKKHHR